MNHEVVCAELVTLSDIAIFVSDQEEHACNGGMDGLSQAVSELEGYAVQETH